MKFEEIKELVLTPSYNMLQVASAMVIVFDVVKEQYQAAVFFGVVFLFATFYGKKNKKVEKQ